MKYTILGHCNVTLGIALDSIYSRHGSAEVEIVSNLNPSENRFEEMPYLHEKMQVREFHADEWAPNGSEQLILSGMSPKVKKTIFEYFDEKFSIARENFVPVIHASAVITNGVELSNSVHISPLSVVAQYAKLGDFVSLNRSVSIGHHTEVGEYTSVNPGCNIGGNCKIGKNVVIGIGATVFDDIEIGDGAVIGGGAVVTKNVEANTLVYGSPAIFIRNV